MTKEKETTIYFTDGNQADVFRYGRNEYSIYFNDPGSTVYGSYLDIAKAIEDYKEKITYTNKQKDDEENYPMVSCGEYLNFWTIEADYDVFIIFHELQTNQHEEVCEKIVHQIMSHRKINDTKEKLSKRIQDALWALVDWEENEPCVFITHVEGSDNK